jgi:arylsulfatase A-like enzyme
VFAVAALVALVTVPLVLPSRRSVPDRRPNVVVIVTDDQPFDSLEHRPPVMSYLQGRWSDPTDHWVVFPKAVVQTPLCCPSRSTILTGRYAHHTGVLSNADGHRFDESSTIATWLADAGYTTGLVGKYLNGYPFGRGPYVPAGWDRWDGKQQGDETSVYHDFTVIQQGTPVRYGDQAYSTDVFSRLALDFVRQAPSDHPFFLYFAPTAPHEPWEPAARDVGALAGVPMRAPPSLWEADVSDKPAWVRALPLPTVEERAQLATDRRRADASLLAVDDAVRALLDTLREEGVLQDTVVFFLTDNGYSFGEHRWVSKSCPYDACVRTPFAVRMPGARARTDPRPISLVDLAPTIAELAGVHPTSSVDGVSIAPALEGRPLASLPRGQLVEFAGDEVIPPWWEVRTQRFAYVEYQTDERELYDLRADPSELRNVVDDPAYAATVAHLADRLASLRDR